MKKTKLIKIAVTLSFLICFGVLQISAQANKKIDVAKGVFWTDTETGTEVYLFPGGNNYRLTVISQKDVKVVYHTRINSIESVDKELTALETSSGIVKHYDFEHHFTKMTIWMALEFTVGGKRISALTRTFYDNIFQTASTEEFMNLEKQPKL